MSQYFVKSVSCRVYIFSNANVVIFLIARANKNFFEGGDVNGI